MKTLSFLIILFILSLVSCKKENNYPIIEPGPYFPVYPDSYWKYLVDDSITIIDSTLDNYELNRTSIGETANDDYTEYCYTPYYVASFDSPIGCSFHAYKYGRYVYNAVTSTQIWPFLSETIGFAFTIDPISQWPKNNILYKVKAKIFNGLDSVLIQEGTFFVTHQAQVTYTSKIHQEFVKGVGLFKEIIYDTISGDTLSKKILIDYHISFKMDL